MSRIIASKTEAGKYNYVVVGDDPVENILVQCTQGFERKAGVEGNLDALYLALAAPTEYLTHAQYLKWRRERKNAQARQRRALKK